MLTDPLKKKRRHETLGIINVLSNVFVKFQTAITVIREVEVILTTRGLSSPDGIRALWFRGSH